MIELKSASDLCKSYVVFGYMRTPEWSSGAPGGWHDRTWLDATHQEYVDYWGFRVAISLKGDIGPNNDEMRVSVAKRRKDGLYEQIFYSKKADERPDPKL